MTSEEVLRKTIEVTKEGSYSIVNGVTTIKTIEGITMMSVSEELITMYMPHFCENEVEILSEKYETCNVKKITEETLEKTLNIFQKRFTKSKNKLKQWQQLHL